MQIFNDQRLGIFGQIFSFRMNDIFPHAAERRIAVQVFIYFLLLRFAQGKNQLPVRLIEFFCIDEFGQFQFFNLTHIGSLLFIAFTTDGVQQKTRISFMIEIKYNAQPLNRIPLFVRVPLLPPRLHVQVPVSVLIKQQDSPV